MDTINNVKNFFASKSYKLMLWIVAELLLLAVVFALGVRVGLHKARYSYQWGANYEKNFVSAADRSMKPGGPMDFLRSQGGDFRNAHGLAGDIVSISDSTVIIKDRNNKENTIVVNDKTVINSGQDNIQVSDLAAGERIVVIGKPDNQGVINAELIRVFK